MQNNRTEIEVWNIDAFNGLSLATWSTVRHLTLEDHRAALNDQMRSAWDSFVSTPTSLLRNAVNVETVAVYQPNALSLTAFPVIWQCALPCKKLRKVEIYLGARVPGTDRDRVRVMHLVMMIDELFSRAEGKLLVPPTNEPLIPDPWAPAWTQKDRWVWREEDNGPLKSASRLEHGY